MMSREKTSIVVEGKDQSCDCRVREEDCVTLALQSETWEKEKKSWVRDSKLLVEGDTCMELER